MAPRNRQSTPATPSLGSTTQSTSTPSRPSKSTSRSNSANATVGEAQQIIQGVWNNYLERTPQRVKLIDTFLGFLVVVAVLQFVYCIIVGNYPFNAFLSGFSATVGQFVLTCSLRMQTNPENHAEFKSISDERAFADYVFGSLLLHFFCVNFIN
ncbi:defender against death DAD protein [Tothia fuscella]|uniref:Dolichyl-diphosphooligosaccharide--protein glycosyltransferase subunit OST2 n=1 Tax=Tothia fuscella TaxID=1048955 RepID=A0A9P4NV89_9PEZI|nr:defender against death DAD protein [Tothia fuscella]